MPKRIFLATKDLMFRSKLGATAVAAGAEIAKDATACDLVVVDVESPGAVDRIRGFVAGGTPVLAYGSHVLAELLRDARAAGATAVPNSEVERRLRAWLAG